MGATSVGQQGRGQRSVQGAARVVSVVGLLDLLDSLALLVTRGEEPWLLDVVWTGPAQPWYVDLCRKRCLALGLASHVRFLGSEDVPSTHAGGAGPLQPSGERSVVVLEAMVNRRSRRGGSARDRRRFDDAGTGASARRFTTRGEDGPVSRRAAPDPAAARARQRAASRYRAVAEGRSSPRRPILDALA